MRCNTFAAVSSISPAAGFWLPCRFSLSTVVTALRTAARVTTLPTAVIFAGGGGDSSTVNSFVSEPRSAGAPVEPRSLSDSAAAAAAAAAFAFAPPLATLRSVLGVRSAASFFWMPLCSPAALLMTRCGCLCGPESYSLFFLPCDDQMMTFASCQSRTQNAGKICSEHVKPLLYYYYNYYY